MHSSEKAAMAFQVGITREQSIILQIPQIKIQVNMGTIETLTHTWLILEQL